MGFFWDIAEAVVEGFYQSIAHNGLPRFSAQQQGRIDRLCSELGWTVDERGDGFVQLHFADGQGVLRKVAVCSGDADVVLFIVSSLATVQTVPPEITQYLLMRNGQLRFGSWTVNRISNGAGFALIYNAEGDGLTARGFKTICEALIAESVDFDGKMRVAGLLR